MSPLLRALILLVALVACDSRSTPAVVATSTTTSASAETASATPPTPPPPPEGEAAGIHFRVHHTAGADPDATLPLIVAIHGLGDRPERFALLDGFPAPARVIYPRGLAPHHGGYSWFAIEPRRATESGEETVRGVAEAADALAAMIAELTKRFPTRGKPIVTGFSQGGMLSFALAVRHPSALAAAVPLAGYLPEALVPATAPPGTPPIVALHGEDDPLIAIGAAQGTVATLRERGFSAELVAYPEVPHSVSAAMLRELYRRLLASL